MRLVKGKARKSIAMAELFNKERADFFLDYGKGAHAVAGMLYQEDKHFMTEKMSSTKALAIEIYEFIEKEKEEGNTSINMYIDGNFTDGDLEVLYDLERRTPELKLTVSVQTQSDGISIEDYKGIKD